jgi:hypothetical protein
VKKATFKYKRFVRNLIYGYLIAQGMDGVVFFSATLAVTLFFVCAEFYLHLPAVKYVHWTLNKKFKFKAVKYAKKIFVLNYDSDLFAGFASCEKCSINICFELGH